MLQAIVPRLQRSIRFFAHPGLMPLGYENSALRARIVVYSAALDVDEGPAGAALRCLNRCGQ
ncbi:MAG: hypothetical protein DMG64_12685 [Acidobacteria bacterium]|nr:MAG: hypothetical protein DMG64_12685 [Acidobacteriota bacterium]PYY21911.1 MAG: hypothetical protein DMG62_16035 [Acidobacteriota bacterium]